MQQPLEDDNEGNDEERHEGGRGCEGGHSGQDIMAEED